MDSVDQRSDCMLCAVGLTMDANFDYHDSITIVKTTITIVAYYHDTITILSGFLKNDPKA